MTAFSMITAVRGKERNMKHNEQNTPQNAGYPQQNGYTPGAYPGSMPYQEYPAQPAYSQQPQGYPQNQGYPQSQAFSQAQSSMASRSYQTPQVTGNQPAIGSQPSAAPYTGQGSFSQNGYQQQGYPQPQGNNAGISFTQTNGYSQQSGYPQPNQYPQQAGYPQPNGYPQAGINAAVPGYGYPGGQVPGTSYIPQTPYSQGYTSPGYQATGYAQGYNAYNQMGRAPQSSGNPHQDMNRQVPLNGGGYVPQPVPVRKKPFVLTDAYLLIASALLLGLFALGMIPSVGLGSLKWVFLLLAGGTIALLWLKPMTDPNKRLCYTIVFGLLALVTVISVVTALAGGGQTDRTNTNGDPVNAAVSGQADPNQSSAPVPDATPTPSVTYTPEPNADSEVLERLRTFFYYWSLNRQDDMLTLCSPSWASKEDNPKTALFALLRNRTPKDYFEENISGTANDTSRTITITSTMDRNNGKDPVKYRMNIMMDKEADGLWYVNPKSLLSYDDAETPDPSVTDTPAPTETPAVYSNTVLYYNPGKGEYYHLDQNCKRIAEKYLPLQGHFTYAEINDEKYKKLKPCAICGAPYRE